MNAPAPRAADTRRTYLLLGVLALLVLALGGGPLRGYLHRRAIVHVFTVDPADGPLPRAAPRTSAPPAMTVSQRHVRVGAVERTYVEVDPTVPARSGDLALVVALHGDGGDAAGFHLAFPYEKVSGERAIVVYPEGEYATWQLGGVDPNPDLLFLEALVAEVTARAGIPRARVFAVGYSSGGFLANLAACRRPGLFRAIASNAGGAPYDQKLAYPNGYPKCEGEAPTAAILLHGDDDYAVTKDSGEFSASYWAHVDGCREHERETTGYAECQAYRGCTAGSPVVWCDIGGLGHWIWDRCAQASWQFFNRLP